MARLPRLCLSGIPQHIIQRGNNRQICFGSDEDFAAYAYWLLEFLQKYDVAIHAWVFMTNHVHLLATPETSDGLSKMMQSLGRQYVRYFNYTYRRTGTLWEGRFKSCAVDADNYLLICQRYIELNPIRTNMVNRPEEYRWSDIWGQYDIWGPIFGVRVKTLKNQISYTNQKSAYSRKKNGSFTPTLFIRHTATHHSTW